MPERGECGLVVVPGGSEVGPSTVRRVQTPSRLGGGGSREGQDTHTHKHDTEGQWHKYGEEKGTEKYVNMQHKQGVL